MERKNLSRTLVLALPGCAEDTIKATEKWLLSLWQLCDKKTWSLWRPRPMASLEYVSDGGRVHYQINLATPTLVDTSRTILRAHFPGIDAQAPSDDPLLQLYEFSDGAISSFRFRTHGWVPLLKENEPDGVRGLVTALGAIEGGMTAVVQMLVEPTWMTTEDGRQPAFWFSGRVAVAGDNRESASRHLAPIGASFGQFAGFNSVRFSRKHTLTRSSMRSIIERRWDRPLLPAGEVVTAAQVATLYHPPREAAGINGLAVTTCRRTPAEPSTNGVVIGEGRDAHGRALPVRLRAEDLLRHAFVIGPSGSGKSTFLANIARGLAEQGHGLSVIDPHGGLVRDVARTLPSHRLEDAYLFNFADTEFPVAINPLRARPGQEHLAAEEVVEVIQRIQGREYWGPLLDLVLRHASIAAVELGGSLVDTARLIDDEWYRGQALGRIRNEETVRFLGQLEEEVGDRRLLPAVNRLQRFLATPWLRNILGQTENSLDFAELFDGGEIALFDLSGIGTTNAKLLGSLLLVLIRQATLNRVRRSEGRLHFVLVDESAWFLSRTVAELLDQARKFGVGIILANQRLHQLSPDDVRDAVLNNAGTLLSFRIHDRDDATFLGRHFGSDSIGVGDLQHLPRYEAYLQLTRDGERLAPAWLQTSALAPAGTNGEAGEEQLLQRTRRRFARPRLEVEAAMRSREQPNATDDEPEIRSYTPSAVLTNAARPPHP